MFRRMFLAMSTSGVARWTTEHMPLSRRMVRRFVAGETLDQAIEVARGLNDQGMLVSLDPLGENVAGHEEATEATDRILGIVQRIEAEGIDSTVSIKLTQLGLDIGDEVCLANARRILEAARSAGVTIQIDMEGSPYTERTLAVHRTLRGEFENVGCVIQSYLYRSMEDAHRLAEAGAYVRLCKGAYKEPPEVAFPEKKDVDRHYLEILEVLLSETSLARGTFPAIATHDEAMIDWVGKHVKQRGIRPDQFEFQMLYGIRRDLQARLAAEGWRVRVYVPFGPEWYPYFMRRLAERPANAIFILKNMVTG